MTKTVITLALVAGFALAVPSITASDEDRGKQKDGGRDGERGRVRDEDERDRPPRERDGNRRPPEGERGPRDGDRPERGRGPRDGDRRPPGPGGPIMALLDTNHNGVLESEEIDQAIVLLRKRDRNRDGKLTGDEIGQPRDGERPPMREGDRGPEGRPPQGNRQGQRPTPEQIKERFLQADKDGDGKLSKEEAPDRMRDAFDRIDADGSGFIEQKELEEMVRRFQQGGRGPRDGEREPRRRPDTE